MVGVAVHRRRMAHKLHLASGLLLDQLHRLVLRAGIHAAQVQHQLKLARDHVQRACVGLDHRRGENVGPLVVGERMALVPRVADAHVCAGDLGDGVVAHPRPRRMPAAAARLHAIERLPLMGVHKLVAAGIRDDRHLLRRIALLYGHPCGGEAAKLLVRPKDAAHGETAACERAEHLGNGDGAPLAVARTAPDHAVPVALHRELRGIRRRHHVKVRREHEVVPLAGGDRGVQDFLAFWRGLHLAVHAALLKICLHGTHRAIHLRDVRRYARYRNQLSQELHIHRLRRNRSCGGEQEGYRFDLHVLFSFRLDYLNIPLMASTARSQKRKPPSCPTLPTLMPPL